MNANPITDQLLAAFADAPELPADAHERALINTARAHAQSSLPDLTAQQTGEAMMHASYILNSLVHTIHRTDPLLDWESVTAVAINVLGVTGMTLYSETSST